MHPAQGVFLLHGEARHDGERSAQADELHHQRAIQGVFAAGMVLHSEVLPHIGGQAQRHVEAAVEELDAALKEIRRLALDDNEVADRRSVTEPADPMSSGT